MTDRTGWHRPGPTRDVAGPGRKGTTKRALP